MVSVKDIVLGALAALVYYKLTHVAQIRVTYEDVIGNRYRRSEIYRNFNDLQLIKKETLESKGYLVDIQPQDSWFFNSLHTLVITEAATNPTSTDKKVGRLALMNALKESEFHLSHTDMDKNNQTVQKKEYLYEL